MPQKLECMTIRVSMFDGRIHMVTLIQMRLDDIEKHVDAHDMKLNAKKTKIIPFYFSRNFCFEPEIYLYNKQLDIIKLLGVICTADCKWNESTKYLDAKAMS